jgi:hypothetical protein
VTSSVGDSFTSGSEPLELTLGAEEKDMIIKMDMENYFDKVHHSFQYDVLYKFGFEESFDRWVKACIDSTWITPLVNGRLTPFFKNK